MGEMHHLKVGCADASVITSNGGTFLIDTHGIQDYSGLLPADKILAGVFITHQHYDHFDGLRFLRDNKYQIKYLIYSPYERRHNDSSVQYEEWREFAQLRDYFITHGAETRTPYKQDTFDGPFWSTNGLQFWMIGPEKTIACSETREMHDASLIVKVESSTSSRKCLFAGDASDTSLEAIATKVTHYCDDILHASHHGSINGAHLEFIKKANADFTVISTESGVHDSVPHPTALERYRNHTKSKVYRTDQDGSLKWTI